jgi:hypothetical protein
MFLKLTQHTLNDPFDIVGSSVPDQCIPVVKEDHKRFTKFLAKIHQWLDLFARSGYIYLILPFVPVQL